MNKLLAYLGPRGTYTEQAALSYSSSATLKPFPSISEVVRTVASHEAAEGIIPIENSLFGSVTETLDLLIREPKLAIRNEIVIAIQHCLIVSPGHKEQEIHRVYSHPQALGQCSDFLKKTFPEAQLIATLSTSAAVEQVMNQDGDSAAIGPERAALINGAIVVKKGIQNNPYNVTRFIVIADSDHPPTGNDKTSICFSFAEDKPGLLNTVLLAIAEKGVNLSKIESRPTGKILGEYYFLIDLNGHRQEASVANIIAEISPATSLLRIFGSYPATEINR